MQFKLANFAIIFISIFIAIYFPFAEHGIELIRFRRRCGRRSFAFIMQAVGEGVYFIMESLKRIILWLAAIFLEENVLTEELVVGIGSGSVLFLRHHLYIIQY